jgi:3-phosphoshikimate 1-carboxyvinyltransferase
VGVVEGLRGLGADIDATDDGFVVRGDGAPLPGGVIDARGDHRMAMLGAIAGLASSDGVEVLGMDAAAVSYPGFEHDLGMLLEVD